MAFSRPTLTDLRQQALQDIQNGGISGVNALLRFSVLYVLAMVLAGLAHLHYGYLDWISKQAVPWTATGIYLEAWGALKGIVRKPATASSGSVSFPISGSAVVPAGTAIQITGGLSVISTADSTISGSTAVVPCTAQSTGAAGNISAGASAALGSPVPGVQTVGTVSDAFTGGADIEQDEDLRSRILEAFEEGGENGNEEDYVKWAKEVSGVTRAWVNPLGYGAGTVVVYIMLDNAQSANNGFPQGTDGAASTESRYVTATGDQLTVANALMPKRSVTALVIVCSPIPQPVDFVINSLGSENTDDNQVLIEAALRDMFRRLSGPGGTIYPNQWNEAIAAIGLSQFNIASPSAAVTGSSVGSMPVCGTVQCVA
ncbi:baseplate J/gp47 family protein [Gluconobacter oxydans]|uniref:baseplate J/gp47 family protein n=1 Tax=Gluconobacter oxydans TaxID=442 RepID=UPI0039E998FC